MLAAALMSLKRKKAYEKQIEQIDNSISRVNEQQMMLENQRTTAETVLALQQGVRANKATMQASLVLLKASSCQLDCIGIYLHIIANCLNGDCKSGSDLPFHATSRHVIHASAQGICVLQEMNIEDVDKTMDEISDAQDQMQQMNDVLAQPIGGAADLDDDELAAELAVSIFIALCALAMLQASSIPFLQ